MKKCIRLIVAFSLISLSVASFVMIFYMLKGLATAGEDIFKVLNSSSLGDIRIKDVAWIFLVLLITSCFVFLLQLLKSVFDVTVKKMCDEAAKDIVNLFEKWAEK